MSQAHTWTRPTLWDVHVLAALEGWKARSGSRVRDCLDAAGEAEALAALAALAADHPDRPFPTIDPEATRPAKGPTRPVQPLQRPPGLLRTAAAARPPPLPTPSTSSIVADLGAAAVSVAGRVRDNPHAQRRVQDPDTAFPELHFRRTTTMSRDRKPVR